MTTCKTLSFIHPLLLFITIVVLVTSFTFGQDDNLKEEKIYTSILEDRKKVKTYFFNDLDSAAYYCERLLTNTNSFILNAQKSERRKTVINYSIDALNDLGYIAYQQGNIPTALNQHEKARFLGKKYNYASGVAKALDYIGYIVLYQRENFEALPYFEEAYAIAVQLNDSLTMAQYINSIAIVYNKLGVPDCQFSKDTCLAMGEKIALEHYETCLNLLLRLQDTVGIAQMYNNIAYIYQNNEEWDKAEANYLKSLAMRRKLNDSTSVTYSLTNLGKFYLKCNQVGKAKQLLLEALTLAKQTGYVKRIRDATGLLADIGIIENDYQSAYTYRMLQYEILDSMKNIRNEKLVYEQEVNYKYEQQKMADQFEYEKNMAIAQKERENQRLVLLFVCIGLAVLIAFLVLIWNRLAITRKQKAIIETQKRKVEFSEQQLAEKNREIIDSIRYAERIQRSILPNPTKIDKWLPNSFIFYAPKDIVAGDFYWMVKKEDVLLVAVADCTGHGVPGAMVSVVCNNALVRCVQEFGLVEPNKILEKTRALVIETMNDGDLKIADGMDIALCAINEKTKTVQYAGANNSLYFLRKGEELKEIKADKQPIGMHDKAEAFTNHTFNYATGDQLYLFTDGMADQFGGKKGKKLKYKPFKTLLTKNATKTITEQKTAIADFFAKWKGDFEQVDDVCIMGVQL